METPQTEEKQMKDIGLKLGQFYIMIENQDYIINTLSQDDIALGWKTILPKPNSRTTTHHFNIYLSQLPPHLWSHYQRVKSTGVSQITLRDRIYHYSIKQSKYDDILVKLFNELSKKYPNRNNISQIYNQLDHQKIRGWIMIRVRYYVK